MADDVEYVCSVCGVDVGIYLSDDLNSNSASVQESMASLMLRHSKWNKERLIEKYMDNPTSLLVAAGVIIPEPTSFATTRTRTSDFSPSTTSSSRRSSRGASRLLITLVGGSKTKSPITSPTLTHYTPRSLKYKSFDSSEKFVCPICFDDALTLRTLSLDCGHTFCGNCWNAYFISKIRDEGEHSVKCMAEGCALVCSDTFIRTVIGPPVPGALPTTEPGHEEENTKAWSHFQELLVRYYVASNRRLKFCPYPGCTNTVSCPSAADKSSLTTLVPTVSCGARGIGDQMTQSQSAPSTSGWGLSGKEHKFCFGCNVEADHRPVVCSVARMWLKKSRDDSETAHWIKSNTKECSNCQSTIEKNGGCKYVILILLWLKINEFFCGIAIWHVRNANTNSVGYAWAPGVNTGQRGTRVIDTMRKLV